MRKRSSSDKNAKKPIFAVVIGINKYNPSSPYTELRGAAEDADRFNNYLTHNLDVPSDNVYNLRDENASRDEIIKSIRWLKSIPKVKKNEAVIIYFAGHGDWTGKGTQMICPSDIGVKIPPKNGRTGLVVEGIYGHSLAKLFRELSRAKGDNITIFLDCCHSTGMLLAKATIKRRITTEKGPSILTSSAIFVEDRRLYTVITACGSRRHAFEGGSMKAGLFTSRLLEVLNSPDAEYLTYISLMHQLVGLPIMQIAHCEGGHLQRPLFNFDPACAGDPSLVLTRCFPDGSIILYAGSAQGIVEGDKLFMHAKNLSNCRINPPSGNLVVASVKKFFSVLLCDPMLDSPHFPPSSFYCKLVDSSTRGNTVLFSSDKNWLKSIFSSDIQSRLSLSIGDDNENYDLRLDISDDQVHFRQSAKLVTTVIDLSMLETINMDDKYKIRMVVERFIHFYSNLARNPAHNLEEIDIELNELIQLERKNEEDIIFIPNSNTTMLADDRIQIQITSNDTKVYGLTVRNRSKAKLYPYLFCFDPMDLTIKELYQPPAAAGEYWSTVETDSLLLPSSELTIGYGSSVTRLHFCLPPGQRVPKIVHLRLYLSSCPTSFESMIRETSPFADVRHRSPVIDSEDDSPQDGWMVKTITFITT